MLLKKSELATIPRNPDMAPLSDREWEVMQGLIAGKTVTTIAGDMELSVKTVSTYFLRVKEKTGLKSIAALTAQAARQGLV